VKKHYKFKLENTYAYQHKLLIGIYLSNNWCNINDGILIIKKGYAWDGCSPKHSAFGLFLFGTPDGVLKEGKPWTYYQSLVHDVLMQFRLELPLSKEQTSTIFRDHLNSVKWPLTKQYVWAVNKLGPQNYGKQND